MGLFNLGSRDDYITVPTPAQKAPPPPQPDNHEHYRVGFNIKDGMVTLTLLDGCTSMTLSITDDEVDHLIRMLEGARRPGFVPANT
jgi:hypothetical protein